MKLATFVSRTGGNPRLGVLVDDDTSLVDVQAAYRRSHDEELPALRSMLDLIESGDEGLAIVRDLAGWTEATEKIALREVRLLAPLPLPQQIRDALCFMEHLERATDGSNRMRGINERSAQDHARIDLFRKRPFWYKCNRFAVTGPDSSVSWPSYSSYMDFELELAVVIGKRGRDLSPETALSHVFGYTIFNDLSARDAQPEEMGMLGPAKSKDFDNANVFGPFIVTADSFDPTNARMQARVNGETWCDNNSSTMHFSLGELLSWVSRSETLHPGEIICSGTVGGGCGLEHGRRLASGDVVELEIEGIGTLRTTVVASTTGAVA